MRATDFAHHDTYGLTASELLALDAPPETGFRLIRAGDLKLSAPDWIIRNVIERDTLAVVFGDFAACKSFFAFDIGFSIATGTAFHGATVKQGPVIYIAGEGHGGLARRRTAWAIAHGVNVDDAPLYFSTTAMSMLDPSSLEDVIEKISVIASEHGNPLIVIIDTVARNFGAGDENSTGDMTRFIAGCDRIRTRYGCAVMLVHHTGHGDKTRGRGSIVLPASVETAIRLDKDDTGTIRAEFTKMKDGALPEPRAFKFRVVELPIVDDEGLPITSGVLVRTDYEAPKALGKKGSGKWQTVALRCLDEVTKSHCETKQAGGYDGDTARVTVDDWLQACVDADMPKRSFYKVRDSLLILCKVKIEHGFVTMGENH